MVRPTTTSIELGPFCDRSIVICGFMGVGKSSVGRKLAGQLDRPFIDLDHLIAERLGRSITEIFNAGEEDLFRRAEAAAIRELVTGSPPSVIALGGGAYADPTTRAMLRERSLVIHLDQSWESLSPALRHLRVTRPLLVDRTDEEVRSLYDQRRASYLEADLTVPIARTGVWVATHAVIDALNAYIKDASN